MKPANNEQWKALYDAADAIYTMKHKQLPEILAIEIPDIRHRQYVYFLNKETEEGIVVYEGLEGLYDILRIEDSVNYFSSNSFVMGNISSIGCFYTPKEFATDAALEQMAKLERTYELVYPDFQSYKKRYYPSALKRREVLLLTRILRWVKTFMEDYDPADWTKPNGRSYMVLKVDSQDQDNYQMYQDEVQEMVDLYPSVLFAKWIEEELQGTSRSNASITIDMDYLYLPISDLDYERPINPLVSLAYDLENDELQYMNVVDPEEEIPKEFVDVFIFVCKERGIPKTIYVRSPEAYFSLVEICNELEVELVIDPVEELDALYESFADMLFQIMDD